MKKLLLSLIAIFLFTYQSGISQPVAFDSLDINNINARINSNGVLFDFNDSVSSHQLAKFEVPKGSGKNTIFRSTLWIGGRDNIDTLHIAAEFYNQNGHDFFAGPISNVYDSLYDAKWNKTWKIYKSDIDYFKAHWWQTGYVIPASIQNWPANGNVALGQANIIAPFFDNDHDGIYNPGHGDYPLIKGDEAIFFVINDVRKPHTESHGNKLGIEVRGMAYAFACNEDSALWNTVFVNYKIYNLSPNKYRNSYVGIYTDLDIGYPYDDFTGCDVDRGSYFGYNAKNIDGSGQPYAYGVHPPTQSVTFLAGPYMDPDGLDNPKYDQYGQQKCDASVNGANFGNGIIDDERLGLTKFNSHYYDTVGLSNFTTHGDPIYAYYLLKGFWGDTAQMNYGGGGQVDNSGYGPACSFETPGITDTSNWGTNCLPPNGPKNWTEITAGDTPDDRRGLGSSGPFTFEPGAMEELDMAYVFGRNFIDTNAWAGVQVMQQRIDSIRKYFINDSTPCGGSFSALATVPKINKQLTIYPNPAEDFITVETSGIEGSLQYEIFDLIGKQVSKGVLKNSKQNVINISNLQEGLYLLNVWDGRERYCRKFIKG